MRVLGIVGWSGSGKTSLLTTLIPIFRQAGVRVSSIKHAHHNLAFDTPGKDSFRHARAGAEEVILTSNGGFALFSRQPEARLEDLLARLAPVDLVLVEGFKNAPIPKLEIHRPSLDKPPLWPQMDMLAVASDVPLPNCPLPVLALQAPGEIADFLAAALALKTYLNAERF